MSKTCTVTTKLYTIGNIGGYHIRVSANGSPVGARQVEDLHVLRFACVKICMCIRDNVFT